jgi:hypothetical protein
LRPPFVHPVPGDSGVPAGEYCDIAAPPKLPAQNEPSGVIAAPQAPPFMPPPLIGLPRAGWPTGLSTVT